MQYWFIIEGDLLSSDLAVITDGAGKHHIVVYSFISRKATSMKARAVIDNDEVDVYLTIDDAMEYGASDELKARMEAFLDQF